LWSFDPESDAVTDLGSIGFEGLFGLADSGTILWAFGADQAWVVDPFGGTVVSEIDLPGAWFGAASAPPAW
jgi:hypothetical protein